MVREPLSEVNQDHLEWKNSVTREKLVIWFQGVESKPKIKKKIVKTKDENDKEGKWEER